MTKQEKKFGTDENGRGFIYAYFDGNKQLRDFGTPLTSLEEE